MLGLAAAVSQDDTMQRVLKARLIDSDQQRYEGRPVLMTRNDYGLGLMNGDIGIALKLPESDGGPPRAARGFPT